MEKLTKRNMKIAKVFAAPFILRILNNFTPQDLTTAIKENFNIVTWLRNDPATLGRLNMMLDLIPFRNQVFDKAVPHIANEEWLKWFISNEMAHKRKDLHTLFLYNPEAYPWLQENMKELATFLVT